MLTLELTSERLGVESTFGAAMAREHFAPLWSQLQGSSLARDPEGDGLVVRVDFGGMVSTTSSYVREGVGGLLTASLVGGAPKAEQGGWNFYPVLTGLSPEVADEVELVLRHFKWVALEATRWSGERIVQARVRGILEPVERQTLEWVTAEKACTATQLHEKYPQSRPINVTAWNKRLGDLHARRMIRRRKEGRSWVYVPLAEALVDG